jgi:hypothetical protein
MTEYPPQDANAAHDDDDATPRYRPGIADGNLVHSIDLGDFMEGLGVVFQLPKRKEARVRAVLVSVGGPGRRGTRWAPVAMVPLLLLAGWFWLRPRNQLDPLPEAAKGVWIANDPRYVGRGFEFDSSHIVFHTGGGVGELTRHEITGIVTRTDGVRRKVNITYPLDGEPMTFAFWLENDAVPTIRFVNQPEIAWTRR